MIDRRSTLPPLARTSVVGSLVICLSSLVWAGCSSNDEYRWEPHVVPGAKPAEKPKSDGKPEPELKLKRPPGTRI